MVGKGGLIFSKVVKVQLTYHHLSYTVFTAKLKLS